MWKGDIGITMFACSSVCLWTALGYVQRISVPALDKWYTNQPCMDDLSVDGVFIGCCT